MKKIIGLLVSLVVLILILVVISQLNPPKIPDNEIENLNKSSELIEKIKKTGALPPLFADYFDKKIYIEYYQPKVETGNEVKALLVKIIRLAAIEFTDCESVEVLVKGCNYKECFTAYVNCSDVKNILDDNKLFDEKIEIEKEKGLL